MIGKGERWSFLVLASIVFVYVALRAALVPWVHDESASIFWYAERGQFLPYVAMWDAGNHYLSTAIGVLAYKLWELSLFGSRIGSVLAFPVYAWAIFRITTDISDRSARTIAWIALLTCPFLLDFFSLFRGYGLCMAFWAVAIDGGIRFQRTGSDRSLAQLLIGIALADLAVLSLVPVWALIIAVTGLVLFRRWRNGKLVISTFSTWSLLGVLPLLFGLLLAWEMRRRGLLYHGTTEGFLPVTVGSLAQFVIGSRNAIVIAIVVLVVGACSIIAIMRMPRARVLLLLLAVLWADVMMRIGMAFILGVNYPEDRAALHMVPLVILVIAFTIEALPRSSLILRSAYMLTLAYLPLRSITMANFDQTLLWPEQSVPKRFISAIEGLHKEHPRPLVIGAYHQLQLALPYSARLHGMQIPPPDVIGFPHGTHDVRIVDERFIDEARRGYREIDRSEGNGLYLLVADPPIGTTPIGNSTFEQTTPTAEFIEIWKEEGVSIDRSELLIEVDCRISSEMIPLNMFIVASIDRGDGSAYYHQVPLAYTRAKWNGDQLHVTMRIPPIEGATRKVVYLWNADLVPVMIEDGQAEVHRVIGP